MRLLQRRPSEIPPAELAEIEALIANGGEVYRARLRENLPHVARIVTAHAEDRLVGASAVKIPSPDYQARIAARAAFPDLADFPEEFGYSVVLPEFRGQGFGAAMLAERLRKQTVGVFATVRRTNAPMNALLDRQGFIRVGREWQGRRGALRLWVRPL
jgi:ribosomal protein S18 acetylase RimI-like enzyme